MNLSSFDGLIWVIACLLPLLFLQRRLHWGLQAIFLLLTRRPLLSYGLFSVLFFPGIVLHEGSHYVMARMLRVKTGRFSLLPKLLPGGKLRLGYVETAQADPLRDSLIGTAPLLVGGAVMAFLAISPLGLLPAFQHAYQGQWNQLLPELLDLPSRPDFWLWFYLAFVVSTTMLPSASDRQSWLPLLLVLAFMLSLALLSGAGPWMLANVAPGINQAFRALGAIFALSLLLHSILLIPVWLLAAILGRLLPM